MYGTVLPLAVAPLIVHDPKSSADGAPSHGDALHTGVVLHAPLVHVAEVGDAMYPVSHVTEHDDPLATLAHVGSK